MKKLLFLLLIAVCAVSCGKDENGIGNNEYSISINPTSLIFENGADSKDVTITSSDNWYLSGVESWCTPSKTYGYNGDVISFSVQANTSIEERSATYTFTCGDKTAHITISQNAGKIETINITTKGTLGGVLTEKGLIDATNLKITGVLNDVDFLFIYQMMLKLKYLDISEVSITTLPTRAFYNSTNVESLILPNILTIIEDYTFSKSKLKYISIPQSIETIGIAAFQGCSELAIVTFENGSNLKTIGQKAFSVCPLTAIEIPASVETIEAEAFQGCSKLAIVTFENGSNLKTIGGYYNFYDYVTTHYSSNGFGAFYGCPLTAIEIPASVETIDAAAFQGCSKLAIVTFENGSNLKTIGGASDFSFNTTYYYGAFYGLKNLMTFDASACTKLTSIGVRAFHSSSALQLFKIGTAIPPTCEGGAFYGINPYSVLKVPSGCADSYRADKEWGRFANISGLDE